MLYYPFIILIFAGVIESYVDSSGILTSPSYPNSYPQGSECIYLISQPNGTVVNLKISFMDIDCQETGTTSDYLELRDGMSEKSPIMGRVCGLGSVFPTSIQSTQNFLRIR